MNERKPTTLNVTFNILRENKNQNEHRKNITQMMNTFANSKLNFVNVFLSLDTTEMNKNLRTNRIHSTRFSFIFSLSHKMFTCLFFFHLFLRLLDFSSLGYSKPETD